MWRNLQSDDFVILYEDDSLEFRRENQKLFLSPCGAEFEYVAGQERFVHKSAFATSTSLPLVSSAVDFRNLFAERAFSSQRTCVETKELSPTAKEIRFRCPCTLNVTSNSDGTMTYKAETDDAEVTLAVHRQYFRVSHPLLLTESMRPPLRTRQNQGDPNGDRPLHYGVIQRLMSTSHAAEPWRSVVTCLLHYLDGKTPSPFDIVVPFEFSLSPSCQRLFMHRWGRARVTKAAVKAVFSDHAIYRLYKSSGLVEVYLSDGSFLRADSRALQYFTFYRINATASSVDETKICVQRWVPAFQHRSLSLKKIIEFSSRLATDAFQSSVHLQHDNAVCWKSPSEASAAGQEEHQGELVPGVGTVFWTKDGFELQTTDARWTIKRTEKEVLCVTNGPDNHESVKQLTDLPSEQRRLVDTLLSLQKCVSASGNIAERELAKIRCWTRLSANSTDSDPPPNDTSLSSPQPSPEPVSSILRKNQTLLTAIDALLQSSSRVASL